MSDPVEDSPALPGSYPQSPPPIDPDSAPDCSHSCPPCICLELDALDVNTPVARAQQQIQRFARLVRFVQPSSDTSERVATNLTDVSSTKDKIDKLLSRTSAKLGRLGSVLESRLDDLESAVTDKVEWCLEGDLTALEYDELDRMLLKRPIQDAERFCAHLLNTLPVAVHVQHIKPRLYSSKTAMFAKKVIRLVQALQPLGANGTFHALHLLIWTLSQDWGLELCNFANLQSPPQTPIDPFDIYGYPYWQEYSRLVRGALRGVLRPSGAPRFTLGDARSFPSQEQTNWISPVFWDFAAARRVLWSAILRLQCRDETCDSLERCVVACPRKRILISLGLVQERALSEVKHKVLLVAGSRLPTEMVELLLDAAFDAESLPADPYIWERETTAMPDAALGFCNPPLIGQWRIKTAYRCETYRSLAVEGTEL